MSLICSINVTIHEWLVVFNLSRFSRFKVYIDENWNTYKKEVQPLSWNTQQKYSWNKTEKEHCELIMLISMALNIIFEKKIQLLKYIIYWKTSNVRQQEHKATWISCRIDLDNLDVFNLGPI